MSECTKSHKITAVILSIAALGITTAAVAAHFATANQEGAHNEGPFDFNAGEILTEVFNATTSLDS